MLLEESNDIGFQRTFSFDGTYITVHRDDDRVPTVELDDGEFLDPESGLSLSETGWLPVTGYSGQQSYNGPIMHESEQFSSNVLRSLYEWFGGRTTYALTVVESYDEEWNEYDAIGWMILVKVN